jgi:hypothetical protein
MVNWKVVSILLSLLKFNGAIYFGKFTTLIVESFAEFGGLNGTKLALKFVCFKANGDVFQGSKIGITTLKKHAPYLSSVYYMAHHTNLVV